MQNKPFLDGKVLSFASKTKDDMYKTCPIRHKLIKKPGGLEKHEKAD